MKTAMSAEVFSFVGLNALQTLSTFTQRIYLFIRDLKLASQQVFFSIAPEQKNKEKKFNFSIKYKILIYFVELFNSKTTEMLLHCSFFPKQKKPKLVFTEI